MASTADWQDHMGFRDRFQKDRTEGDTAQPQRSEPVATVSMADAAYWHVVSSGNQNMANQVQAGTVGDMSAEMQAWFIEHAGQPVNPTESFGVTWYLHQDPGNLQLVDHNMLVATGMDQPANQPGTTIWAMGTGAGLSEEAKTRKAGTISTLALRGVPTLDSLPVIEDSTEAQLRPASAVVDRAVCLMTVAVKAEVVNEGGLAEFEPTLRSIIEMYDIETALSPAERAFIDDPAPDAQTTTQFVWRYEALTPLLWALGHLETLEYPSSICNVSQVVAIIKDAGRDGMHDGAALRPLREILDQLDLTYRLHWAVVEQQLGQAQLPGVEPGVVTERHHALNWLLASRNEAWDEVSTDT